MFIVEKRVQRHRTLCDYAVIGYVMSHNWMYKRVSLCRACNEQRMEWEERRASSRTNIWEVQPHRSQKEKKCLMRIFKHQQIPKQACKHVWSCQIVFPNLLSQPLVIDFRFKKNVCRPLTASTKTAAAAGRGLQQRSGTLQTVFTLRSLSSQIYCISETQFWSE